MKRETPNHYYYYEVKIEWGSKEDDWGYRPSKVLLILSQKDIDMLYYFEKLLKEDPKFKSPDVGLMRISYPVEVEDISYNDPSEDLEDEGCSFVPEGGKISVSPFADGYVYFYMHNAHDCWDIVEGEFNLNSAKPIMEWSRYKEQVKENLEN